MDAINSLPAQLNSNLLLFNCLITDHFFVNVCVEPKAIEQCFAPSIDKVRCIIKVHFGSNAPSQSDRPDFIIPR